jgi:hypothetical protein
MNLRTGLQAAALKTNNIWPFSFVNRAAYTVAIRTFLLRCKRFPQIRSIYLRHSLLSLDWVPGVSDIDLTIIFEPPGSDEKEYVFLSKFWSEYIRLQKYFPMLGEADVISSEFLASWSAFGIRGYESTGWKLLYGSETRTGNLPLDSSDVLRESFQYALLYFFNFFLPLFFADNDSSIIAVRLGRLYSKILRYLSSQDSTSLPAADANKEAMLSGLLERFEETCESMSVSERESKIQYDFFPAARSNEIPEELRPSVSSFAACYTSPFNNFVVFRKSEVDRLVLESLRKWKKTLNGRMLIVTPRLFAYVVESYDSFLYSHLMTCRRLILGEDIFAELSSPSAHDLVRNIFEQVPVILTAYTRPQWFGSFPERMLESLLERALMIRTILKEQQLFGSYAEFRSYFRTFFPDEYQTVSDPTRNKFEQWQLLRSLAHEINACFRERRVM